jgi:hypothetical protein
VHSGTNRDSYLCTFGLRLGRRGTLPARRGAAAVFVTSTTVPDFVTTWTRSSRTAPSGLSRVEYIRNGPKGKSSSLRRIAHVSTRRRQMNAAMSRTRTARRLRPGAVGPRLVERSFVAHTRGLLGRPTARLVGRVPIRLSGRVPASLLCRPTARLVGRVRMRLSGRVPMRLSGRVPARLLCRPTAWLVGRVRMRLSGRVPMRLSGRVPARLLCRPTAWLVVECG